MPYYPTLRESATSQQVTEIFRGYNHNLRIDEGEMYEMTNLTSDYYPMLANRGKRGVVAPLTAPGGLLAKERLAYVDGGKLYYNGDVVQGISLSPGTKQLVSMGAYLVIWPDRIYFNTRDPADFGSVNASASATNVSYKLCDVVGVEYPNVPTTQPSRPENGDYWIDTSSVPHVLKQYSSGSSTWAVVPTVYVKIEAAGIGEAFNVNDGVTISGVAYGGETPGVEEQYEALNGEKLIYAKDTDWIAVIGIIDESYTQTSGTVTVSRAAPDMDFVIEAQNRLWGCKYGSVNGEPINEIYASALGDFRNWRSYQGISTDSYAASVGTDGPWTGAITHLGYPLFFKENVLHKVYISSSGAHQIQDTACRGVQEGCGRSLAIVGERLYYRSRSGIMMYDGSLPESVSAPLGQERYYDAAGGAADNKYYVSMRDDGGAWHLFVFDEAKGLWHREDDTHALAFTRLGDELYCIDADNNKLIAINGTVGTPEDEVRWSATTGLIGYATVERKYVSRFNLRMKLPKGSGADMFIEYDSDGVWEFAGHMEGVGTGTFLLPVRPHRCDHFRFRIEGHGDIRIYSFAKIYEVGSDVT